MELRVISRVLDVPSTPAYQASTMVRSRPKAQIATTRPTIVSTVRSRWRKAFLSSRRSRNMVRGWLSADRPPLRRRHQHALFKVDQAPGARGGLGVVRDHHDGLAEFAVQLVQQVQHLGGGGAVEVAGGLVGDDQRRVGHQCAGDGHALLLAAGELVGVVVGAVGQADHGQHRFHAAALGAAQAGQQQRQLDVLEGVSTGIRL
jgi:hypothetical protein